MFNKKSKLYVFGLSAIMTGAMLAGCSTIEALPPTEEYDGAAIILDSDGNKIDVSNNTMKQIYDALVNEGDTNSEKILNNVLVLYSKSVFGDFLGEVKPAFDSKDESKVQAIADKYEIYHDDNGKGSTVKLEIIYRNFLYRIMNTFYGYVKNSTYQERSEFIEKKFYDAQTKASYSLGSVTDEQKEAMSDHKQVDGGYHINEKDEDLAYELDDYFVDLFGVYGKDKNNETANSYIELAILPDIYRDELVCEYLYRENYRTLGISYARKVNYIKLADNSAYPAATKNLVTSYAEKVIEKNKLDKYPFTILDAMVKGTVFDSSYEVNEEDAEFINSIYTDAGWTTFTDSDYAGIDASFKETIDSYSTTVYKESTFGGYVTNYLKIGSDTTDDTDVVSDFTNSGAYTPETGLAIKYRALLAQDDTTSGWYTSTGLSDAPSDVKNRIFNMGVADEVDSDHSTSNYVYYRNGEVDAEGNEIGEDHYLVIPKNVATGNKTPYVIGDSGNWYLFDVEEAVKSSKLSKTDTTNYYDVLKNEPHYAEYVARAIAGTLSSSDTYKKSSNQYFVKKMALVYHDQSVYDYFKKTFPDLF